MRYEIQTARILLERLGTGPSPVSPWTPEAEVHVREWAAGFGLVRSQAAQDRFRKTAPGELSGRVYATAAGPDRLAAATAWIGWLFLIDDQLDEGATGKDPALVRDRLRPFADMAAEMAGTAPAAEGAPARGTPAERPADTTPPAGTTAGRARLPLLAALIEVWGRISPHMPTAWRATFAQHYFDYLRGCEWEAANRACGRIPPEAEFARGRREAGAIWPSLDLLEYVADAPVPDSFRGDPLLAGIRTACADVVCWTDDLLTVGKERAHGDVHNLVIVLQHATGCDERKALEMVAQRIEARVSDFEELRRRIVARHEGALASHVTGLQHWMRGHLEWGLRTIRYNAADAGSAAYLEDLLSES